MDNPWDTHAEQGFAWRFACCNAIFPVPAGLVPLALSETRNASVTTYYTYMESPIGSLLLAGDGDSLQQVGFPGGKTRRRHEAGWVEDAGRFTAAIEQLRGYFAGEIHQFDLPLTPSGTGFQRKVWSALRGIPYGETRSYGELAGEVGNRKASRAVGAANGRNPIPVIIPCHRVIGSNGELTGFGGGLETKRFLLKLEQQNRNAN